MRELIKAVQGVDYTLTENGGFNIKRGGRYLKKDGVLYINDVSAQPAAQKAEKTNESKK